MKFSELKWNSVLFSFEFPLIQSRRQTYITSSNNQSYCHCGWNLKTKKTYYCYTSGCLTIEKHSWEPLKKFSFLCLLCCWSRRLQLFNGFSSSVIDRYMYPVNPSGIIPRCPFVTRSKRLIEQMLSVVSQRLVSPVSAHHHGISLHWRTPPGHVVHFRRLMRHWEMTIPNIWIEENVFLMTIGKILHCLLKTFKQRFKGSKLLLFTIQT